MSEPVMEHESGAIAYECEFTIDAGESAINSGTSLKFKGYASAEMMRELAGAIYFLAHPKRRTHAERTCTIKKKSEEFQYDCGVKDYTFSCGHTIGWPHVYNPRYCPNCGAKVVKE